ncbi:MAG: hypothetical protein QXW39_03830 [Candidatus Bathyarchaeia archaeon]
MIKHITTSSKIFIIAFSGPDGSGKSTHANLISEKFISNGYVVKRIWVKNVHLLSYVILLILEKINKKRVLRSTSEAIITSSIANFGNQWVWIESINISLKMLLFLLVKFFYKLFNKKLILIADRFILDSMVHILISVMLLKVGYKEKKKTLIKLLMSYPFRILRYYYRMSIIIFLDGKEEIIIKRKMKSKKSDPLWYINLQRKLYHIVIKVFKIPVYSIDVSDRSVIETHNEILNLLKAFNL